jgi:hypothetical protein
MVAEEKTGWQTDTEDEDADSVHGLSCADRAFAIARGLRPMRELGTAAFANEFAEDRYPFCPRDAVNCDGYPYVTVPAEWMSEDLLTTFSARRIRLVNFDDTGKHRSPGCPVYEQCRTAQFPLILQREMASLGIPREYWHFRQDEMYPLISDAVTRYMANVAQHMDAGCGLMLCGPNGVGKTSAMAYIAASLSLAGYVVLWTSMAKLQHEIKDGSDHPARHMQALFVDEFDKGYQADWVFTTLRDLLDYRHGAHTATFGTANANMRSVMQTDERWRPIEDRWDTETPLGRPRTLMVWQAGKSKRHNRQRGLS